MSPLVAAVLGRGLVPDGGLLTMWVLDMRLLRLTSLRAVRIGSN